MGKNKVNLFIAKQTFRVVSDESIDHLKRLEASVNERIHEVQKQYPGMNTARCAILALLNLEDELEKSKLRFETLEEKIANLRQRSASPLSSHQSAEDTDDQAPNSEAGDTF